MRFNRALSFAVAVFAATAVFAVAPSSVPPAAAQAAPVDSTITYNAIWCMAWQESYNNWARSHFGRAQFNGGFPWTDPVSHDLMGLALKHSVWMAETLQMLHGDKPNSVGQNIAWVGGNLSDAVSSCVAAEVGLMNSPEHLSNLLDPRYTEQGVGVWFATDGSLWTTHNFK